MAQFDVHTNASPSKDLVPYLLDVQSDLLSGLGTRVVIPLMKPATLGKQRIRDLHVDVTIQGHRYVAVASELAGIAALNLGRRVGNLSAQRHAIVRAIDLILSGV